MIRINISARVVMGLYRMCLYKNGHCFNIRRRIGDGIHLKPRPLLVVIRGDGLYLRIGSSVYNGTGLMLRLGSPFRNIPILKWKL